MSEKEILMIIIGIVVAIAIGFKILFDYLRRKKLDVMRKRRKKFALHPGIIASITDGDRHYIGYMYLMHLYCLEPEDCILWDEEKPSTFQGRRWTDYIHCYPRTDGEYPIGR